MDLATIYDWLMFVLPDSSNDLWTAIGALATVGAGFAVWKIARNQFELELLPILHAERKAGKTTLGNCGRGVALQLYGVAADDDATFIAASIASGKSIDYSRVKLTIHSAHRIYYSNAVGKWYCLKLVGASINGEQQEYHIGSTLSSVRLRKLPRSIQSKRKRLSRSAFEHYLALADKLSAEHWLRRINKQLERFAMWRGRKLYGVGEDSRQHKYAALADDFPAAEPADAERAKWEIDLSGVSLGCWHTHPIEVHHHAFEQRERERICKVVVARPFPTDPSFSGLVIITEGTWNKLQDLPRSRRNDALFERLVKYLCGRSPKEFFVCVL